MVRPLLSGTRHDLSRAGQTNAVHIVGLDLSLSGTGIARLSFIPGNAEVRWTVKGTAPHSLNHQLPDHLWSCERHGAILTAIKQWCEPKPDLVVVEDVFIGGIKREDGSSAPGGTSALPLSQLTGLVRYWLHCVAGVPFVVVVGASVKKFAGVPPPKKGEKRAKGLICKYVQSTFGHDVDSDNAADAIAMAYLGAGLIGLWQPRYRYQTEALDAILSKQPWLDQLRKSRNGFGK